MQPKASCVGDVTCFSFAGSTVAQFPTQFAAQSRGSLISHITRLLWEKEFRWKHLQAHRLYPSRYNIVSFGGKSHEGIDFDVTFLRQLQKFRLNSAQLHSEGNRSFYRLPLFLVVPTMDTERFITSKLLFYSYNRRGVSYGFSLACSVESSSLSGPRTNIIRQ